VLAADVPRQLTDVSDIQEALRRLRPLTPATIVVTMGERGAAALEGERFYRSEGFDVRAVDTTGAGDVFRGGLIDALLRGAPIDAALTFANAAAAVSCTRVGALNGVPTRAEIERLISRGRIDPGS
jgi:sugar/nucleoside kinase (ribokinase family)